MIPHLLLALFAVLPVQVFAHGEDKPGPHGGLIRMPGAFHTEILVESQTALKIYLLDIQWKNPSVRESDVKVKFSSKTGGRNHAESGTCTKATDHFRCVFAAAINLKKSGHLEVTATRENQKGASVEYSTPFKH